jgi:hypothetical protein
MKTTMWVMLLLAGLAGCGEKPQALEHNPRDTTAFSGTGKAFVAKDWKPGDKTSWESQLKARGQYGQNDYTRMN